MQCRWVITSYICSLLVPIVPESELILRRTVRHTVTASLRSATGRYYFDRCLSVNREREVPQPQAHRSHVLSRGGTQASGPRYFPGEGSTPSLVTGPVQSLVPGPVWGWGTPAKARVPPDRTGGITRQDRDIPRQDRQYTFPTGIALTPPPGQDRAPYVRAIDATPPAVRLSWARRRTFCYDLLSGRKMCILLLNQFSQELNKLRTISKPQTSSLLDSFCCRMS